MGSDLLLEKDINTCICLFCSLFRTKVFAIMKRLLDGKYYGSTLNAMLFIQIKIKASLSMLLHEWTSEIKNNQYIYNPPSLSVRFTYVSFDVDKLNPFNFVYLCIYTPYLPPGVLPPPSSFYLVEIYI